MKKSHYILKQLLFVILPLSLLNCNKSSGVELTKDASLTSFGFINREVANSKFTIIPNKLLIQNADSLPMGVNVKSLKAVFVKTDGKARVQVAGVLQKSGETVNDFSNPLIYNVSEDGANQKNYTVKVNVEKAIKYNNPVINQDAPDPTIIKAGDGYFYLYSTESIRNLPIFRSKDLVNWKFSGTAFTDGTRPNFEPNAGIWAPDINFINGKYVLYFAMSVWGGEKTCGIGVAISDSPQGPFVTIGNGGKLFRSSEIGVQNSIDPCIIEDNGRKYMFWGSFSGIFATELTDDGLQLKDISRKTQIAGNAYEASYVYKKGDFFYLFASTGTCCEGLNSTYTTVVGRSKNVLGPYVNKNGDNMLDNHHEVVIQANNFFKGPGHNSRIVTDDAGNEWILYHTYQVKGPSGRVVALDRIKWIDGWPTIEKGAPSSRAVIPSFNAN